MIQFNIKRDEKTSYRITTLSFNNSTVAKLISMKKLIIGSLIVLSFGISKASLAQSNFDGFYTGLGFGHARGEDKGIEYHSYGNSFQGTTQRVNPEGSLFSAFAGANKMVNENILLGAEIDYETRNYSNSSVQEVNGVSYSIYPVTTKVRDGASLRARLGRTFNNDKTLSYVTGGLATISIKRTYGDNTGSLGNGTSSSKTTRSNGYVVGFGIEHFLTEKVSLRAEYRYAKYDAKMIDASSMYGAGVFEKQKFSDQSFRIGVAYNF